MHKALFYVTLFLLSCNAAGNKEKNKADTSLVSHTSVAVSIDFCTVCDSLEAWQGGIQGVPKSDSTGIYPMAECHTNKTFDLIWVHKEGILKLNRSVSIDSLLRLYDKAKKDHYKDFDCYAYELKKIKKQANETQEGEDDNWDYAFPTDVKIYKRHNLKWSLLGMENVGSFEALGRLKLNSIFKEN